MWMDPASNVSEEAPVFQIQFLPGRGRYGEWEVVPEERLIPFALRFGYPDPGLEGALSYVRFVARKTGGWIRIWDEFGRRRMVVFAKGGDETGYLVF